MLDDEVLNNAAQALSAADALLIAAGAGMGVDSGLPDFRGDHGFWRAYPPYEKLGLRFIALANPRWFTTDPALAWGFYGHRMNLYRATSPHAGFQILLNWAGRMRHGAFVFTSNVDGHFQRAGFDAERVVEIHGSIEWLQCTRNCTVAPFAVDPNRHQVVIDEASMRAQDPLPACPSCGSLARPNILMFGDWQWNERRTAAQQHRLHSWLASLSGARLVIVECGAGTAVPTVRLISEKIVESFDAILIRINPREAEVPPGHIGISGEALETLAALDASLSRNARRSIP
jgi:NAD-dependent SIR2 family protein deacetylase